jgi:flavorubredoxin
MDTSVNEIADGIYRLSTTPDGFPFNQYLVVGEEPLLFHAGPRGLFPSVAAALAKVLPVESLRWISFGHYEADECGAINQWLAAAPTAVVAHTAIGCLVSLNDMADRPPRPLNDGEVIDLGGKRVRHLTTPHVPHGWDAGLLYEETTNTLLCGDLFTQIPERGPIVNDDIVGPAIEAEDIFGATCLTPATGPSIRRLAELAPSTLALMHGPAYTGDGTRALLDLAAVYERRFDNTRTA